MKLSRATIALYVGLVFACGGVVGFFANRLYASGYRFIAPTTASAAKNPPTPEEFRKWLVGQYQTRLHLNDDQMQKLNIILDESQAQVIAIHGQMDPQLDAVRQNQITRMKLMLNADQQAEYDKWRQERADKQKQQRRNGRPNGGPGL
jgi:hypothetical protein